jgi:hypothetical protein
MKRSPAVRILLTIVCLFMCSGLAAANDLDARLRFLQPLMETDWSGGYVGPDAPDLKIDLHFESILDGNAVKYSREAAKANFSAVTHFYWHEGRDAVCFTILCNRGVVGEGTAHAEDGRIVMLGKNYWPDKMTEFRTILEIDGEGVLKDTYQLLEDGAWVKGHKQEFISTNQAPVNSS